MAKKHKTFSHGDHLDLDRRAQLLAISADTLALGEPLRAAFGDREQVKRNRLNAAIRQSEYSNSFLIHDRGFARYAPDAAEAGALGIALSILKEIYANARVVELLSLLDEIEAARARMLEKERASSDTRAEHVNS